MAETTNKYKIQQKLQNGDLLTLHPETDASVVKVDYSNLEKPYDNVQTAIEDFDNMIKANTEAISRLPSSVVSGVKGDAETEYRTGQVNITKVNIGLGNVNNTADIDKPVSTAQQAQFTAQGNRITELENKVNGISGPMSYLGKSTTAITDGGTQAPTVKGTVIPISDLKEGNVVLYDQQEFIWNGDNWEIFGDEGSYVLKNTKINGKALTGDVEINAYEIKMTEDEGADTVGELLSYGQTAIDNILNGSVPVSKATNADYATNAGSAITANTALTADQATTATTASKWTDATNLQVLMRSGVNASEIMIQENSGIVSIDGSETTTKQITIELGASGLPMSTENPNFATYSAVTFNAQGIAVAGQQAIEVGATNQTTPSTNLAIGGLFFKEI